MVRSSAKMVSSSIKVLYSLLRSIEYTAATQSNLILELILMKATQNEIELWI